MLFAGLAFGRHISRPEDLQLGPQQDGGQKGTHHVTGGAGHPDACQPLATEVEDDEGGEVNHGRAPVERDSW